MKLFIIINIVLMAFLLPVASSAYLILPLILIRWVVRLAKQRSKSSPPIRNIAIRKNGVTLTKDEEAWLFTLIRMVFLLSIIGDVLATTYLMLFTASLNVEPFVMYLVAIGMASFGLLFVRENISSHRYLKDAEKVKVTEGIVLSQRTEKSLLQAETILELSIGGVTTSARLLKEKEQFNNGDIVNVLTM